MGMALGRTARGQDLRLGNCHVEEGCPCGSSAKFRGFSRKGLEFYAALGIRVPGVFIRIAYTDVRAVNSIVR